MADGGYRDALTLIEQAILTSDGTIRLEQVYDQLGLVSEEVVDQIFAAMKRADVPEVMRLVDEVARLGRDPRSLLESMMHRLGDLTRAAYTRGETKDAAAQAALHSAAVNLGQEFIVYLRGSIAEAHRSIRDISLPRLWLESELIRISVNRRPVTESRVQPVNASAFPQQPIQHPQPIQQGSPVVPKQVVQPPQVQQTQAPTQTVAPEESPAPVNPTPAAFSVLPTDNAPESVWARAIAPLSEGGKVSPMGMKLEGARVLGLSNDVLDVALPRQMDIGWFNEKPQRMAHLQGLIHKAGGNGWSVRFSLDSQQTPRLETGGAVELPLEGPRLEQLVREVFGESASTPADPVQE
jgi:DNA polymerase-3 subunit gamma/tau